MKSDFQDCLKTKKIQKFSGAEKLIKTEIKAAKEDIKEAKGRFRADKFKYATVNGYYSLFHSARALIYRVGYREKSHYCLRMAIEEFYIKEKILEPKFLEYFDEAMGLRQAADYQSVFSKDGARRAIRGAEKFLFAALKIFRES
jgi:uncharacterized protein (UPF0332 family)